MRFGLQLLAAVSVAAVAYGSAGAVTILDSTFASDGYKLAEGLAAQPQFAAAVAFCEDSYCGGGSGTWIGNDDEGHGYILSAAHVFVGQGYNAQSFTYRTSDGTIYEGESVAFHPFYKKDGDDDFARMGFDFAIVKLTKPVEGIGEAPTLLMLADLRERLTYVGFGARGTGSSGENEEFDHGDKAAAADGQIVRSTVEQEPVTEYAADGANISQVVFFKEDGATACPADYHCPETKPETKTAGAIGAGDSGGGVWTVDASASSVDQWYLAGVNVVGLDSGKYGGISMFAMVPGAKPWIEEQFPGAKFYDPYKE